MTKCLNYNEFFDDSCGTCKQEYMEMKGVNKDTTSTRKFKEFTEERAKRLYEKSMLEYMNRGLNEAEADRKAKAIIRKQCSMRGTHLWQWV
jgi:hypothetical protein